MTVTEVAAIIGASASYNTTLEPEVQRVWSDMIAEGTILVDGADTVPAAEPPNSSRPEYAKRANEVITRHTKLLSAEESAILSASFAWPETMQQTLVSWGHVRQHAEDVKRLRRWQYKAIGRRRRPHCGGRTKPKICRPLTDAKLGLRATVQTPAATTGA
jgi:hypothetical protein